MIVLVPMRATRCHSQATCPGGRVVCSSDQARRLRHHTRARRRRGGHALDSHNRTLGQQVEQENGIDMHFLDFAFWQAFVSNAAATLVGVALGIPIALWISRHQANTEEKERKKKILTLLYDELLVDRAVLFGWHDSQDQKSEARILSAILRYESWKAFSDGGELEWIRDPGLLNTISEAYFMIRSVSQLSDRYFGMLMVDWEQVSSLAMRNVYDNFRMSVSRAIESTDKALKEIGALVTNR